MQTDGRTDRHDVANSCSVQLCERAYKLSLFVLTKMCNKLHYCNGRGLQMCSVYNKQGLVLHYGNPDGAHTFLREKIACSLTERTV